MTFSSSRPTNPWPVGSLEVNGSIPDVHIACGVGTIANGERDDVIKTGRSASAETAERRRYATRVRTLPCPRNQKDGKVDAE